MGVPLKTELIPVALYSSSVLSPGMMQILQTQI